MYSRNPHLVCTVHPDGVSGIDCMDFRLDPQLVPEESWEPDGASYYNGELVISLEQRLTLRQKIELLDWHPLFTGRCPKCEIPFPKDYLPAVHWDCPNCGWKDDSV